TLACQLAIPRWYIGADRRHWRYSAATRCAVCRFICKSPGSIGVLGIPQRYSQMLAQQRRSPELISWICSRCCHAHCRFINKLGACGQRMRCVKSGACHFIDLDEPTDYSVSVEDGNGACRQWLRGCSAANERAANRARFDSVRRVSLDCWHLDGPGDWG